MEKHSNINSQFVTYNIAKKLKELGFDERCIATYRKNAVIGNPFEYNLDYHTKVQLDHDLCPKNSEYENDWVAAPLWQQVENWLFQKYDIYIEYIFDDCLWEARLGKFTIPDFVPDETIYLDKTSETFKEAKEDYQKIRKMAILKAIEICQKENR